LFRLKEVWESLPRPYLGSRRFGEAYLSPRRFKDTHLNLGRFKDAYLGLFFAWGGLHRLGGKFKEIYLNSKKVW
jgi:hypothetical protein